MAADGPIPPGPPGPPGAGWPVRRAFRITGAARLRQNVDDELRFHLEERVEEFMAEGMSREQAEAEARRRFGNVGRVSAECATIDDAGRRRRGWRERPAGVAGDVRYALRGMRARPGYALTIVLTLALAIGANTAIYSAVRSVLVRPLPVPELDRVFAFEADLPRLQIEGAPLSPQELLDLRERTDLFAGVAGVRGGNATLTGRAEAQRVSVAYTMGDFARVLGVRPLFGGFYPADASTPGSEKVVVLGHALWQQAFGGDPGVVGRTITLNDASYTVLGVMPADFAFPRRADLWAPFALTPRWLSPERRGSLMMTPVARLGPGVTPEQLADQLRGEPARWDRESPGYVESGYALRALPLVDSLSGPLREILLVLLGAVTFVLLIACANVASLQLVRTTGRAKEISVRTALGAGRWPIVRQFLVESLVFAVVGGALGIALGAAALRALAAVEIAQLEALRALRLDGPALAAAALVTLLAGILFGVVPAWRASRVDVQGVLKESGGRGASVGGGRHRFLQGAVVVQMALTLVLLLGSAVMVRSLARLLAVDVGFDGETVTAIQFTVPARYDQAARSQLYRDVVARVGALPGVESAALTSRVPFSDMNLDSGPFEIPGAPALGSGEQRHANTVAVTPGYFPTLGARILRGRDFTDADREGAPQVALVNEQLARQYFPGENPVGRVVSHYGYDAVTIVGVVRDVEDGELGDEQKATIFYPYAQLPYYSWAAVVVRSPMASSAVIGMVRGAMRELDPQIALYDAAPMPQRIARAVGVRRLAVTVLGGFAALALVLALLGAYGVLSYSTSQRTHELGIRMALGARPGDVVAMVLRGGLLVTGIGLALGAVGYLGLGRLLEAVLYGVTPHDPVALAAGIAVLAVTAFVACWIPARRAARVHPVEALRE